MAQRRHHYEVAFEEYLRARRVPYVAVDEARKALLPETVEPSFSVGGDPGEPSLNLKSFDFVIYGPNRNLLIEIKGRRLASPRSVPERTLRSRIVPPRRARLESWVTAEDVRSLGAWERLFGESFGAAFIFIYWCEEQPPDALFQEIFEHDGRWYALRCVSLADYQTVMKTRSARWKTVDLPAADFERLSKPFSPC